MKAGSRNGRDDIRPDDAALVRRIILERDEGAFRGLYDRHTPRLLRFVLRLAAGSGQDEVGDVVQETWVRAAEGLGDFRGDARFETWLQAIALNVVREQRRRGRLDVRVGGDGDARAQDAAGMSSPDLRAVIRVDLERALAWLPEGRRTVLVLHDLYGYTHAEIARELGISGGTSKSQLHDARRQLQTLLRRHHE